MQPFRSAVVVPIVAGDRLRDSRLTGYHLG